MTEKSPDKYFYIAVPREEFHEAKHHFYNAPSSYLKVYELDYIQMIEQQNKQLIEALERIAEADCSHDFDGIREELIDVVEIARTTLQQIQGVEES